MTQAAPADGVPRDVRWVVRGLTIGGALAVLVPILAIALLLAPSAPEPEPAPGEPPSPRLHGDGFLLLALLLVAVVAVPLGAFGVVAGVAVHRRWRGAHTTAIVAATLAILVCSVSLVLVVVAWLPAIVLWKLFRPHVRAWLEAPRAAA